MRENVARAMNQRQRLAEAGDEVLATLQLNVELREQREARFPQNPLNPTPRIPGVSAGSGFPEAGSTR